MAATVTINSAVHTFKPSHHSPQMMQKKKTSVCHFVTEIVLDLSEMV